MIYCLRGNKQYIGETKRRLKDRFNEHRRPVDRPTPSSRHTAVSDHLNEVLPHIWNNVFGSKLKNKL